MPHSIQTLIRHGVQSYRTAHGVTVRMHVQTRHTLATTRTAPLAMHYTAPNSSSAPSWSRSWRVSDCEPGRCCAVSHSYASASASIGMLLIDPCLEKRLINLAHGRVTPLRPVPWTPPLEARLTDHK